MDWNTIYAKTIAPFRDFLGLLIEWIDKYLLPYQDIVRTFDD